MKTAKTLVFVDNRYSILSNPDNKFLHKEYYILTIQVDICHNSGSVQTILKNSSMKVGIL